MQTGLGRKNWRGGFRKHRIIQLFLFSTIFTKSEHTQKRDIQISPEQITSKTFVVSISDAFRSATTTKTIPKNHGHPT